MDELLIFIASLHFSQLKADATITAEPKPQLQQTPRYDIKNRLFKGSSHINDSL